MERKSTMAKQEQPVNSKLHTGNIKNHRRRKFRNLRILWLITMLLPACKVEFTTIVTPAVPTQPVIPTVTLRPTWTPQPTSAPIPADPLGTIALDFAALLCSADWMNGAAHLTPCPQPGADPSGGYAVISYMDPQAEPETPILLMVPNAGALFLRYPLFKMSADDRFRTTLRCGDSASCDVEFALDYFDELNEFHELTYWSHKTGEPPIEVDFPLGALAGQSVSFVLTLRLYHEAQGSEYDNGLWGAPHIYRPAP